MLWMYVAFTEMSMRFVPVIGAEDVVFRSVGPPSVSVLRDGRIVIGGVELDFGGHPSCVEAEVPTGEKFHYYGPEREIRGMSTYRRVVLREVYPGIDVVLTPWNRGALEVQFVVRPGGDPSSIEVRVKNGTLSQEDNGVVVMDKGREIVRIGGTYAYQGAEEVPVRPVVEEGALRFRVGTYDPSYTLVIDPVISTVLGGNSEERIMDVAVGPDGSVYVVGYTFSSDYPGPRNDFGTSGSYEVFVTRLSQDLSSILSTAIISSSGSDKGYAIAFLPSGDVVVVGSTDNSSDFSSSRTVMGTPGGMDAFVTLLSPDLGTHVGTAILAGAGNDLARAVAVSSDGNLILSGTTLGASSFAPSRTVLGDTGLADVFVSKVSSDLTTHVATAIVGGTGSDYPYDVEVLPTGNVLVVGWTDFPENFAPSRTIFGDTGSSDVFITKLSRHLTSHIATAVLASSEYDYAYALDIGEGGSLYAVGYTANTLFAGGGRIFGTVGGSEVFIVKMDTAVSSIHDLIFLSSAGYDIGRDVMVVPGRVFVTGSTRGSSTFSTSRVIYGTSGNYDAFVLAVDTALSSPTTAVILAASYVDEAYALFADTSSVLIGGYTYADTAFAGGSDTLGSVGGWNAFVARVSDFTTPVLERPGTARKYEITEGGLRIYLDRGAYVGYDVYDASGRRTSPSVLRLRIGETVETVKLPLTFRGRSRR